jgi:hypothetical protein
LGVQKSKSMIFRALLAYALIWAISLNQFLADDAAMLAMVFC